MGPMHLRERRSPGGAGEFILIFVFLVIFGYFHMGNSTDGVFFSFYSYHRRRRRRNPSGRKGHARRRAHAPRRLRVQSWRVHRRSWTIARKVKRRKRSSPNATVSSWRNL